MSEWDFLWDLQGQEYLDAMATGMTYADSLYIEEQQERALKNEKANNNMYFSNIETTIDRFRRLHSEIIEYYQCIEYDMKRIYSAMSAEDFDENMEWLSNDNWGMILNKLKKLDNSDNNPFFTEEEYALLDEIRTRRNFWCHQCCLEWVYIGDDYKRQNRLERLTRQLENEHNRAEKLQRKMERIYIEEFAEE